MLTAHTEEEDGWKLSKRTGKMFCMEPDSDETKVVKTEVVVQYDIKGVVTSVFLNSEYSPMLQLKCSQSEIETLEQFFCTYTIYDIVIHRDGFLLPFSHDDLTVKFRNNDPKWKGIPFTSIQDRRGQVLETKDITTGAVHQSCSTSTNHVLVNRSRSNVFKVNVGTTVATFLFGNKTVLVFESLLFSNGSNQ
jgi:hypothetical protein